VKKIVAPLICLAALLVPSAAPAAKPTPIVEIESTGVALPGIGTEQDFGAANLPDQIRAYRSSGAWNRHITRIDNLAKRYLRRRVRALAEDARPAMVLDIDDTSLSNWDFWNPLNFDYTQASGIVAWLQSAQDPPIRQTRSLYRLAKRLDVAVFFVTGRTPVLEDGTRTNLARAGYGGRYTLHLKPASYTNKSVIPFKSSTRCRIERRGYRILINVGDQYSDLAGGCADRAYKIPNPMYFLP
jgi:predicted secreted acid phosphatase